MAVDRWHGAFSECRHEALCRVSSPARLPVFHSDVVSAGRGGVLMLVVMHAVVVKY